MAPQNKCMVLINLQPISGSLGTLTNISAYHTCILVKVRSVGIDSLIKPHKFLLPQPTWRRKRSTFYSGSFKDCIEKKKKFIFL